MALYDSSGKYTGGGSSGPLYNNAGVYTGGQAAGGGGAELGGMPKNPGDPDPYGGYLDPHNPYDPVHGVIGNPGGNSHLSSGGNGGNGGNPPPGGNQMSYEQLLKLFQQYNSAQPDWMSDLMGMMRDMMGTKMGGGNMGSNEEAQRNPYRASSYRGSGAGQNWWAENAGDQRNWYE